MLIQLKYFLASNLKNLQEELFLHAQVLEQVQVHGFLTNMILQLINTFSTILFWTCNKIFSCNSHFGTIFSCTPIFQHHLNSHHFTFWIKWFLLVFPRKLWTKPSLWAFIWFLQVGIPTHAAFIYKWSFWDGFWTPSKLFSPIWFYEWFPTIISTLFSYCTRSHFASNYTCCCSALPLSHD